MADDGGAQLGLHRLLRDRSLQFRVILVHAVAVLRVISDILAEHLVVFILNFGFQHRHRAVVGGGQHVVRKCQRRLFVRGRFSRGGRFRRHSGRRFGRHSRRRFGRHSRRRFRRLSGRRFGRHSRRRFGRFGRRFFRRFGGRRFGHNRRRRRFRLFHLRAARSQRNQRNGQHQSQQTLLHQVFPPFLSCKSFRIRFAAGAKPRDLHSFSAMHPALRRFVTASKPCPSLYATRGQKAIVSSNCLFGFMGDSQFCHNQAGWPRPCLRRSLQNIKRMPALAFLREKRPPSPRGEARPIDFNVSNSVSMPTRRVRTCFPGQSPRLSPALRAVSAARRTQ